MTDLVLISGDPRAGSETLRLATVLAHRMARSSGARTFVTVDVATLGAGPLVPGDDATGEALAAIQDADLLIVATPARFGTFSGALKALLDHLPVNALAGVLAVPVVTADHQTQADTAEAFLARLLRELGADVVDFGLTATGPELLDPAATAGEYSALLIA